MVKGPQSAFPFPSVKEATSRSAESIALNALDDLRRSGTKEMTCRGSSASTEMSYSLNIKGNYERRYQTKKWEVSPKLPIYGHYHER